MEDWRLAPTIITLSLPYTFSPSFSTGATTSIFIHFAMNYLFKRLLGLELGNVEENRRINGQRKGGAGCLIDVLLDTFGDA